MSRDSYGRLDKRTVHHTNTDQDVYQEDYTYYSPGTNKRSLRVAQYRVFCAEGYDVTYSYTYDGNGNILSASDGTNTTTYVYDSANQLIRENNPVGNFTYVWTYDSAGNLLSRTQYPYTTGELGTATDTVVYAYGDSTWGDLLTAYDGESITYDGIGNPTSYYNGTRWNLTWEQGRELTTISDGTTTWTNTYDADGMRIKRTNGTNTYEYIYLNGQLVKMHVDDSAVSFAYDAEGKPISIYYYDQETFYYYVTNLQGDVVGIIDKAGNKVVTYSYDAWGNLLGISGSMASTLGIHNPLRYRGYVYDSETNLYYLQSRYYDPAIGRFINADNQISSGSDLTGMNLFAYCGNNPVNRIDPTGEAWWHWALGAAVVAACAVATVVTCGGFAAAATAVCMVGSGVAAATAASTIAAGALIGSATVYGVAVLSAASTSGSVEEFNNQGNWGTVATTAFGGLTGGYDGYTMSKPKTPTSSPTGKGTQNPKVKAAVQKGQAMHKQMDYGPGVLKERTIAPGCRVDGIDFNNRIIYELKPNNPQAIARGMNQLNRYTSAASQQFGGTWTGVLKLYD